MFLACDIGNTRIKTGIFSDTGLMEINSFADTNSLTEYLIKRKITDIAISSVVPLTLKQLMSFLKSKVKISPFVIDKSVKFNISIEYDSIETLGIDRLCSVEGAFSILKNSVDFQNYSKNTLIVVIDFGTATTINVIKYPGVFIGGTIAPGITMMFDSLKKETAQLPKVNTNDYEDIIGNSTKTAIASGVINSTIGSTERVIYHLMNTMKADDLKLFITGGNAEHIIPHLQINFLFDPSLLLKGIKAIHDKNKDNGK